MSITCNTGTRLVVPVLVCMSWYCSRLVKLGTARLQHCDSSPAVDKKMTQRAGGHHSCCTVARAQHGNECPSQKHILGWNPSAAPAFTSPPEQGSQRAMDDLGNFQLQLQARLLKTCLHRLLATYRFGMENYGR